MPRALNAVAARAATVGCRHAGPGAAQRFGVVRTVQQERVIRHLAQAGGQRGVQRVALVERAHETQHLGPVARLLVGLHRPLQRVDVALAAGVQLGDGFERAFRLVVVHQQFGDRHQARGLEGVVVHDAGQPGVAPGRLAHAVRGAGADQGGETGIFRQVGGALGSFLGLPEAAFEQGFQCFAQAAVGFALALALAVFCHACRHAERGAQRARQAVQHQEQQARQHLEQVQRHVDPVRRVEKHDVAGIEARGHRDADGRGHQGDQPEK
jgi:hypothetical protein